MSFASATLDVSMQKNPNSALPFERLFEIQIGNEIFRLSGASISSDAPSYFSMYFEDQLKNHKDGKLEPLHIDRDPETFRDICKHLQGYHIDPRDGLHYVKLFADAQFYCLPRLISQLFESDVFVQISDRVFRIPRQVFFTPGNCPNFFTLSFEIFFPNRKDAFPGLDRTKLLRPPSLQPPSLPNRDPGIFTDLVFMLRGYPLHIRDDSHRAALLRDCRYYRFTGVEQLLIPFDISYNVMRQESEIVVRIEDIKTSGLSLNTSSIHDGFVRYARPFADKTPHYLIAQISGGSITLDVINMVAILHSPIKQQLKSVMQALEKGLERTVSAAGMSQRPSARLMFNENGLRVMIDEDSDVVLDGKSYDAKTLEGLGAASFGGFPSDGTSLGTKRRREETEDKPATWTICNSQWRIRLQASSPPISDPPAMESNVEPILVAVKIDAVSQERRYNQRRNFLR